MLRGLFAQAAAVALCIHTQASEASRLHRLTAADTSQVCPDDAYGSLTLTSGSNMYTLSIPLDGEYHSTLGPDEDRWCYGPFRFTPQCQPCTFPVDTIQNNYGVRCTLNLSSSLAYSPTIQPQAHYRVRPIAELYGVKCEVPRTYHGSEQPINSRQLIHRSSASNVLSPRSKKCADPSANGQTIKFTTIAGGTTYTLNLPAGAGFQDLVKGNLGCTGPGGCVECAQFRFGTAVVTNPSGPQHCQLVSPNEASPYAVYTLANYGEPPTIEWGYVNGITCQDTPFPL